MKNVTITLSQDHIMMAIRWIICGMLSLLVIFQGHDASPPTKLHYTLVLIYAFSNIIVTFFIKALKKFRVFTGGLFLFDIFFITLLSYISFSGESELFLFYFLIIFMSALQQSLEIIFVIAFVCTAGYLFVTGQAEGGIPWANANLLIRIPFLYLVALFAGYFANQAQLATDRLKTSKKNIDKIKLVNSETNELLHSILDGNPTAIVGVNLQSLITVWSSPAQRLFGWGEGEVVGKPLNEILQEASGTGLTRGEGVRKSRTPEGLAIQTKNRDNYPLNLTVHTHSLIGADSKVRGMLLFFSPSAS